MFEKKKEEKRKIEEQKEERKRKREEKKQSKFPANKKSQIHPSNNAAQNPADKGDENLETRPRTNVKRVLFPSCSLCKKVITLKENTTCSECHKLFHKTCIPKAHQIHIPQNDEDDFLCHICYKEDNSDSSYECEDSDSGDSAVDKLYAEVLKSQLL
ncbi:hypothetical protein L9F63_000669 [Diploptera punctata]|uniref:PHD-type domain-containing protein n=1 Tax=Diploptera punctata TaxID=6984 RepID=A0AAD7ZI21_DIPPU|nr:hypothetical protein L9F63_024435 [Diploptera punctata]KAJ9580733.1 hypothetical protein L9F63_024084 [Diploptera punctata]KAJ9581075.1 hypothetical protein L9F63_023748 [Diploptera punctata]KAJ9584717.1 hypothetical protein L9F63_020939 [Diploptera punctata]KAJ9585271.1 hypothetical protein L9F63_002926 [Diploptera punctata]